MPVYEYSGTDHEGKTVMGSLEAESAHQASVVLTERGIAISNLVDRDQPPSATLSERATALNAKDIAFLTEQLLTITQSGLPISPALKEMGKDVRSRRVRRVITDIQKRLESGATLEEALKSHPEAFSQVYLSLIRAGERTGNLPKVLGQLATYANRQVEIRSRLEEVLAYPIFLIIAVVTMLTIFSIVILPNFENIYATFGRQLPWPTRAAFAIGHFFGFLGEKFMQASPRELMYGGLGLLVLWLLIRIARTTEWGARLADRIKLRIPFFRTIYATSLVERFTRCLGMLLSNQAQAPESIILAAAATGSPSFRGAGMGAALLVSHGERLVSALAGTRRFRRSYLWILGNAEEHGRAPEALLSLAESYEREVTRRTRLLLTMSGPALTVAMGLIIAFVVIAMFLPVLNLSSLVGA